MKAMDSTSIIYIDTDDPTTIRRETVSAGLEGPPILEGSRNITLTKIAGKLHDGTSLTGVGS